MITRQQAVEIGEDWNSVNTWADPGVALYAFTSTNGWVQSEEHRQNCLSHLHVQQVAVEKRLLNFDDPEACAQELADLIEYIEQADLRPELDEFTQGYIDCLLWSSHDDDLYERDGDDSSLEQLYYTVDDFSPEAMKEILEVCHDFQSADAELLEKYVALGRPMDHAGHDFWLTRNGHGTGFWDRGFGEVGDKLAEMARPYGSCDIYVGDDGRLYIS